MEHQDTSPEAARVLIELMRQTPVWKRIMQASELTRACRVLIMSDLRRRHPGASEEELRLRLAARVLSRDDVLRTYEWDPKVKGY